MELCCDVCSARVSSDGGWISAAAAALLCLRCVWATGLGLARWHPSDAPTRFHGTQQADRSE